MAVQGGLGRGIEVGLRQPQAMPNRAQQMAARPQQDPNYGAVLDDVLRGEYEQVDERTMGIFNDWGEARNYAQAMWKNFGIDVMTPDFSNPASVMASRAFMQKMAHLRNEANAAKRGLEDRKQMQKWANDPNMVIAQQQEGEWSNADGSYTTGYTDAQRTMAQEMLIPEEGTANYNKARQELNSLLAQNKQQLDMAIESGDATAIKQAKARLANTEMMRIKQAQPRISEEAVASKRKAWIRNYEIATALQGSLDLEKNVYAEGSINDNVFKNVTDRRTGNPYFDISIVNPYTQKIYTARRKDDGSLSASHHKFSGDNIHMQANSILNGAGQEEVGNSELAGYGKVYEEVLALNGGTPLGNDRLVPTIPKAYFDAVDKVYNQVKDLDDPEAVMGVMEAIKREGRPMYLPVDWGADKKNQGYRQSNDYIIYDYDFSDQGQLEIWVRDESGDEETGKYRLRLDTRNGVEQFKELIGYNYHLGNVTLDDYGFIDEDRPIVSRQYNYEPDRTRMRKYNPNVPAAIRRERE